jgi:putrescine transport system permease protein
MISPSLVAGWFLSFSLSLDDLVIASFVSGPGSTTLPMTVFSSVRLGVSPKINALAAIMIMTVSILALVCWYLSRRKEKRDRMQMNMMN